MILLDSQLCELCAKLYDPLATWDVLWTQASWGMTAAKVVVEGVSVVVHRGSDSVLDWYDDLESELIREDEQLGSLPRGFSAPLRPWFQANMAHMEPNMVLVGHSLGAARAIQHAGLLTANGLKPRAVVVWGEPKAGMRQLANVLKDVTIHSYRNRRDPVCTVPVTLGLLDWIHGHELVALDAMPPANDAWGLLADHHIELYVIGMRKFLAPPMV
jgi:hypothetical protein